MRGGAYIPLPKWLKIKNAIINVKNKGNQCLRWALRAALFPVPQNAERPSKYPINDGLDFTGISCPTPLHEIPKVEKLNNIAINVLGYDDKTKNVNILHVSEMDGENMPTFNTILINRGPVSHYCWVKSLSRLLYSQQQSQNNHLYYCVRCLRGFRMERTFQRHSTLGRGASSSPTRIEMPEEGNNTLQFQNYQRQMKGPFVIYADCESIIEKYDTCIPPTERSSTTKTEMHTPCGFFFIAVRSDGKVTKTYHYRGEDCVRQFLAVLLQTESEIRKSLTQKAKMNMTEEDRKAFYRVKECHICKKDLIR